MQMPAFGEVVRVWPSRANVQAGETAIGRFMPADGMDCVWNQWWYCRLRDGEIHFHDPRPAPAPVKSDKGGK